MTLYPCRDFLFLTLLPFPWSAFWNGQALLPTSSCSHPIHTQAHCSLGPGSVTALETGFVNMTSDQPPTPPPSLNPMGIFCFPINQLSKRSYFSFYGNTLCCFSHLSNYSVHFPSSFHSLNIGKLSWFGLQER